MRPRALQHSDGLLVGLFQSCGSEDAKVHLLNHLFASAAQALNQGSQACSFRLALRAVGSRELENHVNPFGSDWLG